MSRLWWITVALVLLLSAGGLAAVDRVKLAKLIQSIKTEYNINGMTCVAVSTPSEDPADLQQIFKNNPTENVRNKISNGDVYKGQRLALAQVKKPEHAEWRVLKDLNLESKVGDLLVIYSFASSCPGTCTNKNNPYNIIGKIRDVINKKKWSKYAFVFEVIFKPKGVEVFNETELTRALQNLASSGIGLENIFRCYKQNNIFQCSSCSTGGKVAKVCVDYNIK